LDVIRKVDVFDGMVDRDAISIGIRSPKLFALSTIYDANRELLKSHDVEGDNEDTEESLQEITALAVRFWQQVAENMPVWRKVKDQHMRAMELRQESLASHTKVMRAIGGAGADLMREAPEGWEDRLKTLQQIDWARSNPQWEGVCIVAGSVAASRQARQATKAFVKRAMRLALSEAETRSLNPTRAADRGGCRMTLTRAKTSGIRLNESDASLVKAMLDRGDRQHDIAAWFGVNGGRIAEIARGHSPGCPWPAGNCRPQDPIPLASKLPKLRMLLSKP